MRKKQESQECSKPVKKKKEAEPKKEPEKTKKSTAKKATTTKTKPKTNKKKVEKVVKVKEPKPQKGFKFVVKDDIKYEVPKTRVEAEYIDDKAHCPTCHQRTFELTSVDCGDKPFMFKGEATCKNCTTRISYDFMIKLEDKKEDESPVVKIESQDEKEESQNVRGNTEKQVDEHVQKRRKKKTGTDGSGKRTA